MSDQLWQQVHKLDKALGEHLAECKQQNKQMWIELREVKVVLWAAFTSSFGLLLLVCGVLLKNHLKL